MRLTTGFNCTRFRREIDAIRESAGIGRKTVVCGAGERMIRSYLIPWTSKLGKENVRLVFRNLSSNAVRAELMARRLDFGILRAESCPDGMESVALKPIPMCLLLPSDLVKRHRKWSWKNLAEIPLVVPEGEGRFARFLRDKAMESGIELDVAMECSTWAQSIDAMRECGLGGFLPGDLRAHFPKEIPEISFPGLGDYEDRFVIAWSGAEAARRPEVAKLWKGLAGRKL